jgi:hypothetical protein
MTNVEVCCRVPPIGRRYGDLKAGGRLKHIVVLGRQAGPKHRGYVTAELAAKARWYWASNKLIVRKFFKKLLTRHQAFHIVKSILAS